MILFLIVYRVIRLHDTGLNRNLVQASKRAFSRPVNKKEPITPDMIRRICAQFAHDGSNLSDLCTALMFVLGCYSFFRINELMNVQGLDILVHDDHLEINVKSSKLINLGKVIKYLLLRVALLHVLTHYCLDIFPQLALISTHHLTFSEHFSLIGRTIRIL